MSVSHARELRARLAKPEILIVPGAVDAITAQVVAESGFPAVYVTGAGYANASYGLPDIGLVSFDDALSHLQRIADAVRVPVIADADTGYGGVLNVRRTVQHFERAGAAAIQLEDQVSPKRCGHFDSKSVISTRAMLDKLAAALDSRTDPDVMIIARTDACAVEGFEPAVERARAYVEMGADMIFVEAPRSIEELQELPVHIDAPLIANMVEGGKTPLLSADELQEFGYRIALFANTALRVSVKAVQRAMGMLHQNRDAGALLSSMIGWEERQRLVGLPFYQELEDRYISSKNEAT